MNAAFSCVKPPEEKLNQSYLLQLEGTEGHARSVDCIKIYRVWICIVHFTQTKFKGRKLKAWVYTTLWWCVLTFRSYVTASLFRHQKTGTLNVPICCYLYIPSISSTVLLTPDLVKDYNPIPWATHSLELWAPLALVKKWSPKWVTLLRDVAFLEWVWPCWRQSVIVDAGFEVSFMLKSWIPND